MLHTPKGGRKRECPSCLPSVGQLAVAWEAAFINNISSWLRLVIGEVAQKQNKVKAVSKQEISSWKCQRASKGIFRRGLVVFIKCFTGCHACCFPWFLLLWFSQADQKVWASVGASIADSEHVWLLSVPRLRLSRAFGCLAFPCSFPPC